MKQSKEQRGGKQSYILCEMMRHTFKATLQDQMEKIGPILQVNNMSGQPSNESNSQHRNVDVTTWQSELTMVNLEFDDWMTRQLNCLVGRYLSFTTQSSSTARAQIGSPRQR